MCRRISLLKFVGNEPNNSVTKQFHSEILLHLFEYRCTFRLIKEITSRNSRKKAPKKGTTGHSGIANARANARSYSEDRRADERYSST
ncbi:Protein of unknown function, partial [Cotesia congregata]